MRPGQNRRMRGRNNNRRGPNPLSRPYESNGPDVKVRGTAQHIAEKYLQLARDAQSSGDHVMGENYLQHAEHYFRIVLAAQEALAEQTGQQFPPQRQFGDEDGEEGDEGDNAGNGGGNGYGNQQQGYNQGERQNGRQDGRQDGRYDSRNDGRNDGRYDNRPDRNQQDRGPDRNQDRGPDRNPDGNDRPRNENRNEQGYRGDRQDNRGEYRGDRPDRNERFDRRPRFDRDRQDRGDRDNRPQQGGPDPAQEPQPAVTVEPRFRPRQPEIEDEGVGLPAFVTAPVRQVINATPPDEQGDDGHGADEAPVAAPRRRGRPRKDRSEAGPVES